MQQIRHPYRRLSWVPVLFLLAACSSDTMAPAATSRGNQLPVAGSSPGLGSGLPGTPGSPTASDNPAGLTPFTMSSGGSTCRAAVVAFVIDGSGSMCAPFGNATRWTALRSALMDKTAGLVYRVQMNASFGMYLYDGSIDLTLAAAAPMDPSVTCTSPNTVRRFGGQCPQIIEIKPAVNNAMAIDAKYPTVELGGSTPTDQAMAYVVNDMVKQRGTSTDPEYIILATDGAPNNICTGGTGGDGTAQQQGVIAAVDMAASMGITTFVISLASDPVLQMNLDLVAKHGDVTNPTAHTYSPSSPDDLVKTLTTLLGQALNCPF
jgi:hypothetical protein